MTKHIPRLDEIQIGEHIYIPIEVAAKITGIPAQVVNDLACQGRIRAVCLGPIAVLERESIRQYKADLERLKKGSREERKRVRQAIEARDRQAQEAVQNKSLSEIIPLVEEVQIEGKTYVSAEWLAMYSGYSPHAFDDPKNIPAIRLGEMLLYEKAAAVQLVDQQKADQERLRAQAQRQQIEREALQRAIERGTLFS